MKHRQFYIILLLFGILVSCKKKDYPTSVGNGVAYYFKGDVNGNPVLIEAGNDDYYMFSSVSVFSNSVATNNFKGDLRKINCTNCAPAFQMTINDYKVTPLGSTTNIDSALRIRNYPIISSGTAVPYKVVFESSYNKIAASYLWDFGDGTTSTDKDPSHIYKKAGTYNVCVTIKEVNGCTSSICSEQKINLVGSPCKSSISVLAMVPNVFYFYANATGTGTLQYTWDFGDGATAFGASPSHTYLVAGSYPVTLKVTDSNNDVARAHYNAVTISDMSSCAANYKVKSETFSTDSPEFLNLSGVTMSWTDANGVVYTTNDSLQPSSSFFEVITVEEGDRNEKNQKTKKLHIRFKAIFYNGTQSITINNGEAVIGVAYN